MSTVRTRSTVLIILVIMLVAMPVIGVGCQEEKVEPPSAVPGMELSSTLVPNTDFDLYVYIKQENPTTVPKDIIGTPFDVAVESLALWGMPTEDSFTFGGALKMANSADAANLYGQIPSQGQIWTSLSNHTIYFVQGSGVVADTFKSVISENDFKYYNDQPALLEVSLFPDGGTTKLAAVAICKPSQTLVKLIAKKAAPEVSGLLEALLTTASLRVVTAGLYAPQPVDITKMAKDTELISILESDVGILASIKSGLPSVVVSTIVGKALESTGYVKAKLGELTIYKGYLDTGSGKTIPIMLRVKDNRMFAAISGEESYAETLITNLNI